MLRKNAKSNTNVMLIPTNMDEVVTRRILKEEFVIFEAKTDLKIVEQRKEFERYVGAIAEEFHSRLSAVAEMVAATAEDMSSIKEWIREDHARVHSIIDVRLSGLEVVRSGTYGSV